ncbi:PLP-dependent aminotransferase family protein [Stenotrophomonas sp.]|uniref:aminotransferase-like domain-containing protein n=1 Tax=Stenotrophomonas sp. TaxID=69392 RepID=UPI0028AE02EF|nr:PLP-dependent aminotransferase family protein [Stenotrophomonas sp.]
MTSLTLAGAAAANNNGGHLSEPTDGYGQAPAVGSNDTPKHLPYMRRQSVAGEQWISRVREHSGPIYLRIVSALEAGLSSGELLAGQRLPSQRSLAKHLQIDLTTVTRAFEEGRKRGLIEARGPHGSFVAPPKASFEQRVDLSMNVPPVPDCAHFSALLRRTAAAVLARSDANNLMTYHLGGGNATDRHAASRWLKPMLGDVEDSQLILTEGAQVAISAVIVSLGSRGRKILCDQHVYPGLLQASTALQSELVPVEGDEYGMRPDSLVQRARESGSTIVYLNPTLQNPTALTMPYQRRVDIARVLRQECIVAIEDDPYWHFESTQPQAISSMAPQSVYYISTLSKMISPGLRTAFMRCPSAEQADKVMSTLRGTRQMGHPLISALASQVLLDGSAYELMERVKEEAHERVRMAGYLLPPSLLIRAGGLHAWCSIPQPWSEETLVRSAHLQGLSIAPSSAFRQSKSGQGMAMRLSLGLANSRRQLEEALSKIDKLLLDSTGSTLPRFIR